MVPASMWSIGQSLAPTAGGWLTGTTTFMVSPALTAVWPMTGPGLPSVSVSLTIQPSLAATTLAAVTLFVTGWSLAWTSGLGAAWVTVIWTMTMAPAAFLAGA